MPLFLYLSCQKSFAQGGKDSLLKVLPTYKNDTNRVLTLLALFRETAGHNLQEANGYVEEAYDLSIFLNYRKGIIYSINNIGVVYMRLGNYQEALKYHMRFYEMVKEDNDSTLMSFALTNMGGDHYHMTNFSLARNYYEENLEITRAIGNKGQEINTLNDIGSCYLEQGNYPEALSHYLSALEIGEDMEDIQSTAMPLGNIGQVYLRQKQDSLAFDCFSRAMKIYSAAGDNTGLINMYSNFGDAYKERKDFAKAEEYFQKGIDLCDSIGYLDNRPVLTWKAAEMRLFQGNEDQVLEDYKEVLRFYVQAGSGLDQCRIEMKIGQYFLWKNEYRTALENFSSAEEKGLELNANWLLMDCYKGFAQAYAGLGDYGNAYAYQNKFFDLYLLLFSAKERRLIAEMQQKYEAQKKEKEFSKMELSLQKSRTNNFIMGGGLTVAVLLALFLILLLRQKNRTNREMADLNKQIEAQRDLLEQQNHKITDINAGLEQVVQTRTRELRLANEELDAFLYEAAHALRRPITSTKGLLDLIESESSAEGRKSLGDKIEFILDRMDRMLHKLIMINENNRKTPRRDRIPVRDLVEAALERNGIIDPEHYEIQINPGLYIHSDRYRLDHILDYVLENSLAFQQNDGKEFKVTLSADREENGVRIKLRDNGIGIKAQFLQEVFEMFSRGTEMSRGNGLGLFVTRKFMDAMGGKIGIDSREMEYTEVSLWIPDAPK